MEAKPPCNGVHDLNIGATSAKRVAVLNDQVGDVDHNGHPVISIDIFYAGNGGSASQCKLFTNALDIPSTTALPV